jgi:hypothetical protein
LPDSLYALARKLAEQVQASLNQFITLAVAEKVSDMNAVAFFAEQAGEAKSGDLATFLTQVTDLLPSNGDEQ